MAELSNAQIVLMGIGTVFVGLIFLILICYIMSAVVKAISKQQPENVLPDKNDTPIENKQVLVAAICAVIAEEIGEDVKNIKVVSFKRI